MRFDEASARFAEFGPFYTGMVADLGRGAAAPGGGRVSAADSTGRARGSAAALCRLDRVVVAFSGGADSAFLARVAHDTLGARPGAVRDRDLALACPRGGGRLPGAGRRVGAALGRRADRRAGRPGLRRQRPRPLRPLQDGADGRLGPAGRGRSGHRGPGRQRGRSRATTGRASRPPPRAGARFPLVDAGFTKAAVREWSRRLGLRTWDKPAAACLSSRVPYGTPVTARDPAVGGRGRGGARRPWVSPSCGCGTTGRGPDRGAEVAELAAVVAERQEVVERRAGRRLRLRHPGPRGVPLGQPEPGPARGTAGAVSDAR